AERRAADIVCLIVKSGGEEQVLELIAQIRRGAALPIVVALQEFKAETAGSAFRAGARDVVSTSATSDGVAGVCYRAGVAPGSAGPSTAPTLIGKSPSILDVLRYVNQVGRGDGTVLITGETGTGKEVTADLIHTRSRRSQGLLVTVNCAAL